MEVLTKEEFKRQEKAKKEKIKVLKKLESTLKKSLKNLTKDINKILDDGKVWYCADEWIKDHEEFHKPNDRNGDQLIIDSIVQILNGGEFWEDDIKKLWTKEDIEK